MGDTVHKAYVPYDYRRVCDICGNLRNRSEMVERPGYTFVCSYHPNERTALELSEAIASTRPIQILPVPDPKPQNNSQPQNYEAWEAQIFNLATQAAPAATVGGASDPVAAAWVANYMADIVIQGTRPATWLATARTVIATCLAYLAGQQFTSSTTNIRYGAVLAGANYSTRSTVAMGLALLKGYLALGTASYLVGAVRCATFLRRMQCGDLLTSGYSVYPSGGGAYHLGGLDSGVVDATGAMTGTYGIYDIAALWFFKRLGVAVGTSATFGDASAVGSFSAATQATLATMIGELGTFAALGVKDSAHNGSLITGLSVTAPSDSYSAYLNTGGGSGTWSAAATIPGLDVALAVRGVFEGSGLTSQVSAVLAWLAAFAANPANATPSTNTADQTLAGITGVYSPAVAPATSLTTSAPFTEATGALYSFAALGVLSPILATTAKANLQASRDVISNPQPTSTFNNYIGEKYLGTLGVAGLSLQPKSSASASTPNATLAAQSGEIYRQAI